MSTYTHRRTYLCYQVLPTDGSKLLRIHISIDSTHTYNVWSGFSQVGITQPQCGQSKTSGQVDGQATYRTVATNIPIFQESGSHVLSSGGGCQIMIQHETHDQGYIEPKRSMKRLVLCPGRWNGGNGRNRQRQASIVLPSQHTKDYIPTHVLIDLRRNNRERKTKRIEYHQENLAVQHSNTLKAPRHRSATTVEIYIISPVYSCCFIISKWSRASIPNAISFGSYMNKVLTPRGRVAWNLTTNYLKPWVSK